MEQHLPSNTTQYRGRALDVTPVNLSLSRQAIDLLQRHAPGRRAYGRFLSELVIEFDRRGQFEDLMASTRKDLRKMLNEIKSQLSGNASGNGKN
jgi:hypothetical protein